MPQNTTKSADRELAPSLQPLANELKDFYELSLEKAVSNLFDPKQFPMPKSEQTAEHLFLRYLQKKPDSVQQQVVSRFQERRQSLQQSRRPALKNIELKSDEPIITQIKRVPTKEKFDFSALVPPKTQIKSHNGGSSPISHYSGVRLRLRKVFCKDETNPEGGHDEILIGGVAYPFTLPGKKVSTFFAGEFDEEDPKPKEFNKILTSFNFADDDIFILKNGLELPVTWPREYNFVLMMAEEDLGGFSEELQDIYSHVKDTAVEFVENKIKETVGELTEEAIKAAASAISGIIGGAAGSSAPGIGNFIGWLAGTIAGYIVGWLFDVFEAWIEDDYFLPKMVTLSVPSPTPAQEVITADPVTISGHGGTYKVFFDWEFFGLTETISSEYRVKEHLGPFVKEPFVDSVSDFILQMGENSLKTAMRNWKGF